MKKLIMFFCGLLLLALTFGALVLSGMIYDTGKKTTVETYFFQPNNYPIQRPGVPASPQDLQENKLRDLLLSKYLTEYFYVTPDLDEVTRRKSGKTGLRRMSNAKVFENWVENVAPEIEKMAQNRMLRTVTLVGAVPEPGSSEYWRVEYELKTWTRPNDLAATPTISRGVLYMNMFFEPQMRQEIQGKSIEQYLESGGDPAVAFRFGILDIATQE